MSLQELIELAILDAMGLLDEKEQAAFESAFRIASPAVQAQVRREQTRLSRIEALLPNVSPPAGLRAAVIEAVRTEIASPANLPSSIPTIYKSRGVSYLWRASALGCAAAAIVLGVVTFQLKHEYGQLQRLIQSDSMVASLNSQFGATFVRDVLFAPDTRRVVFKPVAEGFKGEASVFLHPQWKAAKFFAKSVAPQDGRAYRLAIVDDNNEVVRVLDTITSDGRLFSEDVELNTASASHLAIIGTTGASDATVVLSRAELKS